MKRKGIVVIPIGSNAITVQITDRPTFSPTKVVREDDGDIAIEAHVTDDGQIILDPRECQAIAEFALRGSKRSTSTPSKRARRAKK